MRQFGEIELDHRASPGLPEDIARQAGYVPELCGEGKIYRQASITCAHCKCTVVKNPFRTRDRAKCFACDNKVGAYLCDPCAFKTTLPNYVHVSFEKLAEQLRTDPSLTGQGSPPRLLMP